MSLSNTFKFESGESVGTATVGDVVLIIIGKSPSKVVYFVFFTPS